MSKTKDELLRDKILAGADMLFQKYGLTKTTMEDIAKEAGKGKSTLYYYFKSKEEIFDAIIQREKAKLFDIIQEAVAKVPTAREKLGTLCKIRFENVKVWKNLYNVMIEEVVAALASGKGTGIANCYRGQYDQKDASLFKSILQYGIVTGEFRVFSEQDLDMMAFMFVSTQHGLEMDLVVYDRFDEFATRFDFMLDLLIHGIHKEK